MDRSQPTFPTLDAPTKPTSDYSLPLETWNRMAKLAQRLGDREAEEPLRRRMASFLTASNQAYSSKR